MGSDYDRIYESVLHKIPFESFGEQGIEFKRRLDLNFPKLVRELGNLYGARVDFEDFVVGLLSSAFEYSKKRSEDLHVQDRKREADPRWFQSQEMLGGVCYIDLYAESIQGLKARIPYLKELGLTYLHLMPPYKCPAIHNDGGYAVSSYRETNPAIGSMEDLRQLAQELRNAGISLWHSPKSVDK